MQENQQTLKPETVSPESITPENMPTPTIDPNQAKPVESAGKPADSAVNPSPAIQDVPRDNKGNLYNPLKHLPKINSKTGVWLPRGGRRVGSLGKPKNILAPAAAENQSYIPTLEPPAPAAEAKPSDSEKKADATSPAAPAPAAAGPAGNANESTHDGTNDAGEVGARAAQFILGLVFDSPDDCTPSASEHRNMVSVLSSWIKSKGWKTSGGFAVALMFFAWVLRVAQKPRPHETIKKWFKAKPAEPAKNITPEELKPKGPTSPAPSTPAQIINLPANIPPLAKS